MRNSIKSTIAASVAALIQLVAIILKLCGVVDWNWACVMIPTIIVGSILIAGICIIVIMYIFSFGDGRK